MEFVLSRRPNIYELHDPAIDFRQTDFVSAGWSGTGNLFVWTRVFQEVGLFDPTLISHEDSEWGLRATAAGKSLGYAAARGGLSPGAAGPSAGHEMDSHRVRRGAGPAPARALELHLWRRKANWRPLWGTWRAFPEPIRSNGHLRMTFDLIANVLRAAGNLGSFLGDYELGPGRAKRLRKK